MTKRDIDDQDFASLLRDYAAPVADNGFTAATLTKIDAQSKLRTAVLFGASILGGVVALSQMPSVMDMMNSYQLPNMNPLTLTLCGLLGFVAWAALDRGWSDVV